MSVFQVTGGWSYKTVQNVASLKTRSTVDSDNYGMLDRKMGREGRVVERRGGENSLRRMGAKTHGFVGMCHRTSTTYCENALARQQFTQ